MVENIMTTVFFLPQASAFFSCGLDLHNVQEEFYCLFQIYQKPYKPTITNNNNDAFLHFQSVNKGNLSL